MIKDPTKRSSSLEYLHPQVRERAACLIQACHAEGAPFEIFETYRHPERQAALFKKRVKGKRVTKAKPWRSYHQYGLAVDIVLKPGGNWSWSTKGECKQWWKRLHILGREQGLEPLSWEKPHMQLSGFPMSKLRQGEYPGDGDDAWVYNLNRAIERWDRPWRTVPPPADYDNNFSRPSLTACGLED